MERRAKIDYNISLIIEGKCWFFNDVFFLLKTILLIIIFYSFGGFHTTTSWWSFTGVWETASLLKSSGLYSVFWPILIILLWRWSPLVLLLPNLPVSLPILWGLFWVLKFQLVSPLPSCSMTFSVLGLCTYLAFFFLSVLLCYPPEQQSHIFGRLFYLIFLLTITRSGLLAENR